MPGLAIGTGLGMSSAGGGASNPPTTIVMLGNSLTYGFNSAYSPPEFLDEGLPTNYTVVNRGYPSETTQQLTARLNSGTFDADFAGATRKVLVVWEVRNDLANNSITVAQAHTNLQTLCAAARSRFSGVEIYVATTIASTAAGTWNATNRDAVNALIVANYASYADGLIDFAADSRLMDNTSLTYFLTDQIHDNTNGARIIAGIVGNVVAPGKYAVPANTHWLASDLSANLVIPTLRGRGLGRYGAGSWQSTRAAQARTTGKYYFEARLDRLTSGNAINWLFGLASAALDGSTKYLGQATMSLGLGAPGRFGSGFTITGADTTGSATTGTVFGVAVDLDAGKVWFSLSTGWKGDPVAGTGQVATFTPGTALYPALSLNNMADTGGWELKLSTADFSRSAPTGYSAWV